MISIRHLYGHTFVLSSRILIIILAGFLLLVFPLTTVQAQWNTNGNNISNSNSGNVGVGTSTTAPDVRLTVHHTSANTNMGNLDFPDLVLGLRNTSNTNGNITLISFQDSAGWGNALIGAVQLSQTSHIADLVFLTRNGGVAFGERMRIKADGSVGIGTSAPTAKLHVVGHGYVTGNLTVDGNIAAKYQDVAEWVPGSNALAAGTVVTLDPNKTNHIEASSKAYDTRVAGVVSTQPGITLGTSGEGKVLVATTGRVRIKVDASAGSIEIGDLLVTSDLPGVAMKSQPINVGGVQMHRPGTLIGKAVEPLAKGTGEILVLLSLQ